MSTLEDQFKLYSKFGDCKSDGKTMTLSQSDKWMKQAKVIDKKITTVDTGIAFKKFKSMRLGYPDYSKFLEELAKQKKMELKEIEQKLIDCGPPGTTKTTAPVKSAAVDRLTDSSRYTGSHKERFDETGKGKGKAGREEVDGQAGYVSGYKNKDSYDKTGH